MNLIKDYTLEIKKSKFIGLMYHIESESDVENILNYLKSEHKKAKHLPYAYRLINTAKKSDDKEPHNTAGTPILLALERENMENTLIVIIRYFGGIKLGSGPLLRAYASVANSLLKK